MYSKNGKRVGLPWVFRTGWSYAEDARIQLKIFTPRGKLIVRISPRAVDQIIGNHLPCFYLHPIYLSPFHYSFPLSSPWILALFSLTGIPPCRALPRCTLGLIRLRSVAGVSPLGWNVCIKSGSKLRCCQGDSQSMAKELTVELPLIST